MTSISRYLTSMILTAIILLVGCNQSETNPDSESEEALVKRARGIHERVITLDTHNDIGVANFTEQRNYTMDLDTQVNLPKMKEGGLDVTWLVVYVGQGPLDNAGYAAATNEAMTKFNAIHWLTDVKAPDQIELAYTSDDVRRIAASGKKVAMIAIENAYQVGLDLDNIRLFQEIGGRYMSLAHNGHNQFSDSNTGERDGDWLYHGLSELGKQAIVEMNKWGIMIDISHPSKEAIMQMFEISRTPLIASHSAARALSNHRRNLDDEQLMALKANGGVVQTVALGEYVNLEKDSLHHAEADIIRAEEAAKLAFTLLDEESLLNLSADELDAYEARLSELNDVVEPRIKSEVYMSAPPVDVSDFVDQIDYMVDLIGLEHVGISSDFDGGGGIEGWDDASETFNVTLELVRRGYSEEEIGLIWSGNLLRVLDEVQRVAAEMQAGA